MSNVGQPGSGNNSEHKEVEVAASVAAAFGEHVETPSPQASAPQEQAVTQTQTTETTPQPENTVEKTLADGQGIEQAREVVEQVTDAAVGAVTTPVTHATQTIEHHFTPSQYEARTVQVTNIPQLGTMTDNLNTLRSEYWLDYAPKPDEPVTPTESTS